MSDHTTDAPGILLVEDDPSSQDLIRALCESQGHAIDVASDGFLGLRLLSEQHHAIVLIDYHLPEMDGYALARLMREIGRSDGKVRLVGVTADRDGLASRRGADKLFDAILVKPLDPALLFATIDRLLQPDPAPARPAPLDPAAALWARRALAARPRALICPTPSASQAEALGNVFTIARAPDQAEIVLVIEASGIGELRAIRAAGPAGLLPAVDLTGQFGNVCDVAFQVGDPNAWSALAQVCRRFAERRSGLPESIRRASDPETRLLALLHVAERDLHMSQARGVSTASCYETGHSPAARMAAILSLTEAGLVVCEPKENGVAVSLTAAARERLSGDTPTIREPIASKAFDSRASARAPVIIDGPAISASSERGPLALNIDKQRDLIALIGTEHLGRLQKRLAETLDTAFDTDLDDGMIARQAHVLISMAGSLGFDHLAGTCRNLESAITTRSEVQLRLAEARSSCATVRTLLSAP